MTNAEGPGGPIEWPMVAVYSGHMTTRGARIKRARQVRRMSQLALALATGVGQRTIGRIEKGERDDTTDPEALDNLEKLESYLGITPDTDDQPGVTEPVPDPRPPHGAITQFGLTELLAEALSRVAQFEAQTGVHIGLDTPVRVRWATEDAPSAHRAPNHPGRGVSGAK
jgi:transcriptional regulator with XRE-family HTH domain